MLVREPLTQEEADQPPVDLAKAKQALKIHHDDDDGLICSWLWAAVEMADAALGRSLLPRHWVRRLDAFPGGRLLLMPDVQSVVAVRYIDRDGVDQLVPPENYSLIGQRVLEPLKSWPAGHSVRVGFIAAYCANSASVPDGIRNWLYVQAGTFDTTRQVISDKPFYTTTYLDRLLDGHRYESL
ncbi:head-tail connector protein [Chitinimonas koreensis]|uniref:head-tail connector protein n=1 Tax=Chitinimonas koreensis TaxID=356302 RepID=UPI0003F71DE9|nr:hypothetical protein [Chitinimonas koreensis]QNM94905.1 hypothetical protein H9L41_13335 [Chitinimonas koreensis]